TRTHVRTNICDRLALGRRNATQRLDEGCELFTAVARVLTSRAGRVGPEPGAVSPCLPRPNRPRLETTAAVRAHVVPNLVDALRAERALVRADARIGSIRREVLVAELAVRTEFEHRQSAQLRPFAAHARIDSVNGAGGSSVRQRSRSCSRRSSSRPAT